MSLRVRAVRFAAFLFLSLATLMSAPAFAALTYSWTGAASDKWSNPGNWNPAGVPTNGDTLAFPYGASNTATVNDLPPGTAFDTVGVLAYGYALSGNPIVVTSSVSSLGGDTAFALPIDFQGNNVAINVNNSTFSGSLSGSGTLTLASGVQLQGPGTFSGTITSASYTFISLNGASLPNAHFDGYVYLQGHGTIGAYTGLWVMQPSGGVITTGDATFNSAAYINIAGPTPGTGYSQIAVNGTLTLGNGSLNVGLDEGFVPTLGQVFTIFTNDGTDPVVGTFQYSGGEGALFQQAGTDMRLSYVGGDGNDITLTVTATPHAWTGASSTLWSDPANWNPVGTPQSGDRLLFPSSAANHASTNDIAGLALAQLVITGSSYVLSGNGVAITGLMDTGNGSDNVIALPLDFGAGYATANGWGSTPVRITGGISGTGSLYLFGFWQLEGANAFSGTFNNYGMLNLANNASLPAAVNSNYMLLGHGTIGALDSQTLQPDGLLATGNFALHGTYNATLSGTTAGTGYPQVQVTGSVFLDGNSTLTVAIAPGFTPAIGQEYVLIANDGTDAVSGAFNGAAEGSTLTVNGIDFRVSYHGGDGNDVTITCLVVPRTWTGAGDGLWSNALNWSPAGVPQAGERLLFPDGAARTATTNDLPAGTSFNSIVVVGQGYRLSGNAVVLTAGLSMPQPASNVEIALPLDFQTNNATIGGNNGSPILIDGGIAGSGTLTISTEVQLRNALAFSGTFVSTQGWGVTADNASMPNAAFDGNIRFTGYSATVGNLSTVSTFQVGYGIVATRNLALGGTTYGYIGGAGAGTGYTQVQATGTVSLGAGATLQPGLSTSFVPSIGAQYVLIANDGTDAISGIFAGQPEGSTLTLNGVYQFRVTYVGGDGNDFALVSLNGKPSSTTTISTSGNPANDTAPPTFTATVTGAALPPTGSVSFFDGTTEVAQAALSNGVATYTAFGITPGSHDITASYAGDSSYGGSASAAIVQVIRDTTQPTVAITGNPAAVTNNTSATFTYSANDLSGIASVTCQLDATTVTSCPSPYTVSGLAEGAHTFTITVVDGAGNSNSRSWSFTIDTTAPVVTLAGPFTINSANAPGFAITGTCSEQGNVRVVVPDLSGFDYNVSCTGGAFTTGNANFTGLLDGTHSVTATQQDVAGNSTTASSTISKGTVAPTITLDAPAIIASGNQGAYPVAGDCSVNGQPVAIQVGSVSATTSCTTARFSATVVAASLAQGAVSISAAISDTFGNSASATAITTKDTVGPTVTIDTLDVISNANRAAYSFGGTCEPGGTDVTFTLTAGAAITSAVPCSSGTYTVGPLDVNALSDGTVSVQVAQRDSNGNATVNTGSVAKDTQNPSLAFDPPAVIGSGNAPSYTVTGTCSEAGRDVAISIGTVTGSATCTSGGFSFTANVSALPDGPIAINGSLSDGAGNTATASATAQKSSAPQPPMVAGTKKVDFDGDGKGDLAWSNTSGQAGAWLMNGLTPTAAATLSGGTGAMIHALGDFNGDGRTDILWRMPDGSYRMTLMTGLSTGTSSLVLAAGTGWEVIGTADFNGDGKADLLWKHPTAGYGAWLMNGATMLQASGLVSPGAGFEIHMLADFDGDRQTDVLWRHPDGRVKVTLMHGLAAQPAADLAPATSWTPDLAGDLDGDGKDDLLWSDADGTTAAWLMNGTAAKAYGTLVGPGTGWSIAQVGDLDGDGHEDLVWKHTDGRYAAWLMNGTAAKAYGPLLDAGTGWTAVTLRDLNGDGRKDIVVKHTDGSVAGWLMNGVSITAGALLLDAGTGWSPAP